MCSNAAMLAIKSYQIQLVDTTQSESKTQHIYFGWRNFGVKQENTLNFGSQNQAVQMQSRVDCRSHTVSLQPDSCELLVPGLI